jgi:hypothetical protein
MASSSQGPAFDKSSLIKYVQQPSERYLFHNGDGFRYEELPVGTRVIYPPPPLAPIQDVDAAIEEALENPLGCDPFSDQLRAGMRVTIAFDDISLPLPPMVRPDLRGRIIEKVLEKLAAHGVDDIHLIAALGLHRRMTPKELKHALGSRITKAFGPDRLYNHDAEDPDGITLLGETSHGEIVEVSRRVAESDLLVYVNLNLASMDGGNKSITTGLTTYRTLRHHHNAHTLLHSRSYMDPPNSELHHSIDRMGALVEKSLNVFKIETTLNSHTFPPVLSHLQKPEDQWNLLEKSIFAVNRRSLGVMPYSLRRSVFHALYAPYGLTGIAAGQTDLVHEHTMANVFRQQSVPVKGQADIMMVGLPYLGPYNVNSIMNPILVHCLAVGYIFNLYRGKPLVREGGVYIFMHPLDERFNRIHHPSYIDFYHQVLSQTRDPAEMERLYEESFAHNPRYIDLYRNSYAFHGVHPFYMWYWACHGQAYLGRVIVVGGNPKVAAILGYDTAPSLDVALEMAKDTVGPTPQITDFHMPPVFLCDVE